MGAAFERTLFWIMGIISWGDFLWSQTYCYHYYPTVFHVTSTRPSLFLSARSRYIDTTLCIVAKRPIHNSRRVNLLFVRKPHLMFHHWRVSGFQLQTRSLVLILIQGYTVCSVRVVMIQQMLMTVPRNASSGPACLGMLPSLLHCVALCSRCQQVVTYSQRLQVLHVNHPVDARQSEYESDTISFCFKVRYAFELHNIMYCALSARQRRSKCRMPRRHLTQKKGHAAFSLFRRFKEEASTFLSFLYDSKG